MVTLARRRAIDGCAKSKLTLARRSAAKRSRTATDAWVHNATEEAIVLSDTRVLIRKVISGLPPAQQQAIDLAFFRGMSQREIAAKRIHIRHSQNQAGIRLKKIYDGLKELRDEL